VLLACISYDYPVFLENAEFFVNGRAAGQYRGHAGRTSMSSTSRRISCRRKTGWRCGSRPSTSAAVILGNWPSIRWRISTRPDLRKDWKLFDDNRHFRTVAVPLEAAGRHLETDVALPAEWQGKDVYLEFEVADRWVGVVVINGRAIGYNQSLHPYANIMQVNLYPWAKTGAVNRIELWPRTPEETPSARMVVRRVRIGTVGPARAKGRTVVPPLFPIAAMPQRRLPPRWSPRHKWPARLK